MANRYTLIFFSLLIAVAVFLWVAHMPSWASACLLLVSLFFLTVSISFHSKIQQLSKKHFSEKKLDSFTTLSELNEKINENEEKLQLISTAIESIGSEKSGMALQFNSVVGCTLQADFIISCPKFGTVLIINNL